MKIHPVVAEMCYADGETDIPKVNSRFRISAQGPKTHKKVTVPY